MGAGCSSSAGKASEAQPGVECPPRPAYLACDLVGPPLMEKVRIAPVDTLLGQAAQFAETVCSLNDMLNCALVEMRIAVGMLQGGFGIQLLQTPNVDVFSFELLTAEGRPLEMAEAARLRGRDLTHGGRLAALDAKLAQCLEDLVDLFARNVGVTNSALSLSSSGTLVPRTGGQPVDPVVEEFNQTMSSMRGALGADYLLALHLHKAQAHGMPAFRVRLLKPAPNPLTPSSVAPAAAVTAAAAAAVAGGLTGSAALAAAGGPSPPPHGFQVATLLDQTACLSASRLADSLHAFQAANGRLAAALKKAGLDSRHVIVPVTPRSVALAGTPAADAAAAAAATGGGAVSHDHNPLLRRGRKSSSVSHLKPDPVAAAASAARHLPAASRLSVGRAVEGLNTAVHSLGHAAAAAPGPASLAALFTHVLGELRDVVAAAGGDPALETYQPAVHFVGGPDDAPSLDFLLDPRLQPQGQGQEWDRPPPPFPDCLSPPVRRAWLLLWEVVRVQNSAVGRLGQLRQLAAALEEGLRRCTATLPQDAVAARMTMAEAAEAGQALLRNHVELRACWQGALQALLSTALLVRDEMAEAAQLARVQCSFMSPMAWSISIASSALALPSPGSAATGSLSSMAPSSTTTPTTATTLLTTIGAATPAVAYLTAATGPFGSPTPSTSLASAAATAAADDDDGDSLISGWRSRGLSPGSGGASAHSRGGGGAAKSLASSFAAAAAAEDATSPPPGSPPDVLSQQDQRLPQLQRSAQSAAVVIAAAGGGWPSPSPPDAAPAGGGGGSGGGSASLSRSGSRAFNIQACGGGAAATLGSRSIERITNTLQRMSRSRDSGVGWVPMDEAADGGGGGGRPMGQSQSPSRPQRPAAQSPALAAAAVAGSPAAVGSRGGRVGGESLADEYARTALAHLRLQEL